MKKTLAVLLVLILGFGMIFANGSKDTAEDGTFTGEIYWLNFKPEVSDAMKEIASIYTAETGIKTRIETAASGTYGPTLSAEMDKSNAPSIFVCERPTDLLEWYDYSLDLTDTELAKMMTTDTYTLKGPDGSIRGISYALESWGIIVNKSIMEKYFALPNKKTSVNSLEEIRSFDTLKAVVEDMQANKDALGINGVFGSTALKAGDDWRYQTHLLNNPLYWEWVDDGIDLFGAIPECNFEYGDNYKAILDLYLNNSVIDKKLVGTKTVDDSMAEFALGQCAMIQNGDWAWNSILNTAGAVVTADDVCFIPIYDGTPGEEAMGLATGAGQYMVINCQKSEAEQQAALDFLVWLFSSETGKELVAQKLQFVTPFKTMSDAVYTNPLFASENQLTAEGLQSYPWTCNLIPSQTFKNELGANLLLYAQGQMTWDQVMDTARKSWAVERDLNNANR